LNESQPKVSPAFATFLREAPGQARAWMTAVRELGAAGALDRKTEALAYSAVLLGLPAAGNGVTAALPVALEAYDAGPSGQAGGDVDPSRSCEHKQKQ